jgi:uroporphyrinogen decarboxylase
MAARSADETMTKRLLRVLAGETVWPAPVWLMRQAGRYLPEYRAVRGQARDFLALCLSPDLATEITLQPLRRYGMDAAILFSDILMLPYALGQDVGFAEGEGPKLAPIRDAGGLAALDRSRMAERIAPILETVRRVRVAVDRLPGDPALIGFAGAPFTVACYMLEGHGGEFATARTLAWREPEMFGRLIDLLTETTVAYLSAQIEAGAETVMLFDSWAGLLPPALFRAHVIAPVQRIVAELRQLHPRVPAIGFPRLGGWHLPAYAETSGVAGLGMDTTVDPAMLAERVPACLALQGNLDPLALLAGGKAMRQAAAEILAAMRGRPFIFNLGHGIVPATPPEHVAQLVRLVRDA